MMSFQEVADLCRWQNLGYQDGQPGSIKDIEKRLQDYERNVDLYIRSEQHLKSRLTSLEKAVQNVLKEWAERGDGKVRKSIADALKEAVEVEK